ncbi:MAG: hypothetical protein COV41_02225 [Candidatus Brennerbacteria bacterium CG11_big_fil_rev_8_21_14_0_20_43_10]|uniref:UDP-N-acetylmuramoyl-L-alanyl-D-glutamate--2, 6-diaminopimelate ligase n=3 Tax=Candidatus Brenneribacteriota TaxID=1817902 RepID=A0A2M8C1S3_9BACT|nr:MAG: hypothetical protein AUJ43_01060 [Parcubacteria group bacterium CG1_02_44_31]PIP50203.1 MAG: hypothetical protein COX12_02650 [Candidatus Brennerbacteria bacterium CG23_combo_of_CG06-09_8_20_14_all_44_41]PIR26122.1 MAG: hypothetical protein COV41_02225 [Candidatus Brennerbacteria bacterium CG11_big_fil_rev_8_21_14_0_20_43_10]PIX28634.1 MAG: hypothetical protein COZ64_02540 [Candidatus Brennerbacteria bacterium CG_4_8_14_3_um_filter_43_14]PJA19705.1 MAG: hypothetical protein COX61_00450 
MRGVIRFIKKLIRAILPSEEAVNYCWHLPIQIAIALRYGLPGHHIKVIGIAGTKGKTSTAHFISQLLESTGEKTALYSTTTIKIGNVERLNDLKMTTPSRTFLQRFLRDALKAHCTHAVIEVSSHGLKQFRLWGIPFAVAVLTNMTPDHLDYHKTAQDYTMSHMRMIGNRTRAVIVNGDDENLKPFAGMRRRIFTFGKNAYNIFKIQNIQPNAQSGMTFEIEYYGHRTAYTVPYIGEYNAYNTAAALATLYGLEIDIDSLRDAVSNLAPAPGRMEYILCDKGFDIIVDYAHSPESFEKLFQAITPALQGNLIAVTGACGDRDATVRPDMGRLLAKYCQYVVITNDDPYTEDPEKIMQGLISGLTTNNKQQTTKLIENVSWFQIPDRRKAIRKGIELARKGDTVLVLGKGAEQWQVFKDKKIPWDDRKIVQEILNK